MSKKIKKILSVFFVLTIALSLSATVNAADDDYLMINSAVQAKVGDKVKFAVYMSDCTQEVIGIDMTVFYDSSCLAIDPKSLEYEKFDGAVQNAKLDGYFKFNWTQLNDGQDFSKRAMLVSAEFEVIAGGETEISHFITEMYDYDIVNIDPYKITYDISVNNSVAAAEQVPVINTDRSNEKKLQGSFVNYLDGMGDKNTANKDDHQSFMAEQKYISQEIQSEFVDVTRYENADGSSGMFSPVTLVMIIAVVIVVLAIAAVLIARKKSDVPAEENEDLDDKGN